MKLFLSSHFSSVGPTVTPTVTFVSTLSPVGVTTVTNPVPCLPAITDSGNIRTSFLVVAVLTTVALCPDFTSTV